MEDESSDFSAEYFENSGERTPSQRNRLDDPFLLELTPESPETVFQEFLLEKLPSDVNDPESGNDDEEERNFPETQQDSESSDYFPCNQQELELGEGSNCFSNILPSPPCGASTPVRVDMTGVSVDVTDTNWWWHLIVDEEEDVEVNTSQGLVKSLRSVADYVFNNVNLK